MSIKLKLMGKEVELFVSEGSASIYDEKADNIIWIVDLSYSDDVEEAILKLIKMVREE